MQFPVVRAAPESCLSANDPIADITDFALQIFGIHRFGGLAKGLVNALALASSQGFAMEAFPQMF